MGEPESRPLAADESRIEGCAKEVFRLWRAGSIAALVAIGKRIIDDLYEGDLALWNQYNRGDLSVGRLAEKLAARDPEWTKDRLDATVKLFEQSLALNGFDRWPELSATHFKAVQSLPTDQQIALLDEAQTRALTVATLRGRVDELRGGGRPAAEPVIRAATETVRLLRGVAKAVEPRALLVQGCQQLGLTAEEFQPLERLLADVEREVGRVSELIAARQNVANEPKAAAS